MWVKNFQAGYMWLAVYINVTEQGSHQDWSIEVPVALKSGGELNV